jgi:Helix-turn-helix
MPGLTQIDVAAKLGVGQAAVSKIERQSDMLISTLASSTHRHPDRRRCCASHCSPRGRARHRPGRPVRERPAGFTAGRSALLQPSA